MRDRRKCNWMWRELTKDRYGRFWRVGKLLKERKKIAEKNATGCGFGSCLSDSAPHSRRGSARRVLMAFHAELHQPHHPAACATHGDSPGSSCPSQPITGSASRFRQAGGRKGLGWDVMFPGSHPVVTDLITSSRRRFARFPSPPPLLSTSTFF